MARKRKATDDSPSKSDRSNKPLVKRPKIDWSVIEDFRGFTVSSANTKAPKKLSYAATNKQNMAIARKPPKYPGQDAPLDANVVQSNPFPEAELSQIHVKISPALYWESTSRYRKFTINSEEFQVGQIVFVKNSEGSGNKNPPNAVEGWLAKILEIRAGDSSHVFLRVFWVYRPEDLPGGRQPHHGSNEVIVSNHMDVIEALTVQSLAETVHWNDDPDSLPLPAEQLFFRQSYDIAKKSNPFSALNKYCKDKQPINPDELLVQCSYCSEWMHAHCLEQDALRKVSEAHQTTITPLKQKGQSNKRAKVNSDKLAAESRFDVKLSASDTGKVRLTITDNHASEGSNTHQWDVDISCLVCGKIIERADDSLQPTDPNAPSGATEETESENVTVTINTKDTAPDDAAAAAAAAVSKSEPEPLTPAGTNAPRKRGRPPGSVNKKKRASASANLAKESNTTDIGGHAVSPNTTVPTTTNTTTATTQTSPTTNAITTTTTTTAVATPPSVSHHAEAKTTPAPAPVHESLLHSSVLSIKNLLWSE